MALDVSGGGEYTVSVVFLYFAEASETRVLGGFPDLRLLFSQKSQIVLVVTVTQSRGDCPR